MRSDINFAEFFDMLIEKFPESEQAQIYSMLGKWIN